MLSFQASCLQYQLNRIGFLKVACSLIEMTFKFVFEAGNMIETG